MPETKPPVSQTKTAEQSIETAQKIREYTYGKRGPVEGYVERIAAIIEAAKESELAALREASTFAQDQLRRANETIAELRKDCIRLAASERIAEGLATLVRRFRSSHRFMRNPCKKDPCDMCLGAKSVLARYQAQKGKP